MQTYKAHIDRCYCDFDKSLDCCIRLGCKVALYDSGHIRKCKNYKTCICLESGCSISRHQLPCVCNQSCTCTVYHCDIKSGCCDRKPWQKCRYYAVELCEHCDYLRRCAIALKIYNKSICLYTCECECSCDYECDGYCKKCETHDQQGWNLLNWQKFRRPKIFTEQPKHAPYYFEHYKTNEQIKTCCQCLTEQLIMKKYDRKCRVCFDVVCYKCCSRLFFCFCSGLRNNEDAKIHEICHLV
jgi:hypothetical protein